MNMFTLRFPIDQVHSLAKRYGTNAEENLIESELVPLAKAQKYLSRDQFLAICRWKSRRPTKRFEQNDEAFICEVTTTALTTENERLRIEVLTLLCGVEWPTASVILHWCASDRYPILDFRALWSLGTDVPKKYDFAFWWEYTQFCRQLADEAGVPMRTLDRALWQFSKENQPPTLLHATTLG
jgi:hypothetical protein